MGYRFGGVAVSVKLPGRLTRVSVLGLPRRRSCSSPVNSLVVQEIATWILVEGLGFRV